MTNNTYGLPRSVRAPLIFLVYALVGMLTVGVAYFAWKGATGDPMPDFMVGLMVGAWYVETTKATRREWDLR